VLTVALEDEIKALIIEVLNFEGVKPEDIDTEADLFGPGGLDLDSIDALEIGVGIHRKYGIKLTHEDKTTRAQFKSVRSLADLVAKSI
jgi:acyl carrier protein